MPLINPSRRVGPMRSLREFDALFRQAVAAIDAGDIATLERLLGEHPELVRERLTKPGPWLTDQIGGALKGFFKDPYLLWFVSEDAPRNRTLPKNIAEITRGIIQTAKRERVESLQEQLDYTLQLVSWSGVAADCGVQLELIDVLVDAGASPDIADSALVNGHVDAARRLLERGAKLTLASALCLGRWSDVSRLAEKASSQEKQMAFVLAALNGNAEALATMLRHGADLNAPSKDLYAHATPVHHAVCSGSLEAVKVLVEAGANLTTRDRAERATPLGWAEYFAEQNASAARGRRYAEIAEYLREHGAA